MANSACFFSLSLTFSSRLFSFHLLCSCIQMVNGVRECWLRLSEEPDYLRKKKLLNKREKMPRVQRLFYHSSNRSQLTIQVPLLHILQLPPSNHSFDVLFSMTFFSSSFNACFGVFTRWDSQAFAPLCLSKLPTSFQSPNALVLFFISGLSIFRLFLFLTLEYLIQFLALRSDSLILP